MLTRKLQQWQWVETVGHIGVNNNLIETLPDLTIMKLPLQLEITMRVKISIVI